MSPDVTHGLRLWVTEKQENQQAGIKREIVSNSKLVLRVADLQMLLSLKTLKEPHMGLFWDCLMLHITLVINLGLHT